MRLDGTYIKEICPNSFLLPQPGLYLQDEKKPAATLGVAAGKAVTKMLR